jgi:hypothetical protein
MHSAIEAEPGIANLGEERGNIRLRGIPNVVLYFSITKF